MLATDADFGARQTLYAVSQDLPGNTFVGPRFGHVGPTAADAWRSRRPERAAPPPRSGSCPNSSPDTKFPL